MLSLQAAQNIRVFLDRTPVQGVKEAAALVNAAAEVEAHIQEEQARLQLTQQQPRKKRGKGTADGTPPAQ